MGNWRRAVALGRTVLNGSLGVFLLRFMGTTPAARWFSVRALFARCSPAFTVSGSIPSVAVMLSMARACEPFAWVGLTLSHTSSHRALRSAVVSAGAAGAPTALNHAAI